MAQIEQATERLQTAIDRLDRAIAARTSAKNPQDDELRTALLETKQENALLQATAGQASERLDSLIARLRTLLES